MNNDEMGHLKDCSWLKDPTLDCQCTWRISRIMFWGDKEIPAEQPVLSSEQFQRLMFGVWPDKLEE